MLPAHRESARVGMEWGTWDSNLHTAGIEDRSRALPALPTRPRTGLQILATLVPPEAVCRCPPPASQGGSRQRLRQRKLLSAALPREPRGGRTVTWTALGVPGGAPSAAVEAGVPTKERAVENTQREHKPRARGWGRPESGGRACWTRDEERVCCPCLRPGAPWMPQGGVWPGAGTRLQTHRAAWEVKVRLHPPLVCRLSMATDHDGLARSGLRLPLTRHEDSNTNDMLVRWPAAGQVG